MANISKNNIEVIRGMSYKEYIEDIGYDRTLQFQFDDRVFTDQRKLLKGTQKFIFYFFLFGYLLGPLVFVPLLSYKYDNWYLLFGILFSYFSTFLSIKKIKGTWVIPLIALIFFWFKHGFHLDDYYTFFWVCYFLGGIFYQLAVDYEEGFAKIEVMKNEDLFNSLSQNGSIFFMKKNEEFKESHSSEAYILSGRFKFESQDLNGAILDFDKAIELSPNYGKAYLNRALAKSEIADYESSILDFNKAIELSPKDGVGYFG